MTPYLIAGFDTETLEGPPMTFQFFGNLGTSKIEGEIEFLGKKKPTDIFFKKMNEYYKNCQGKDIILFGFNLKFDLLGIFHNVHDKLVGSEFEFEHSGWKVTGVYDKVFFAILRKDRIKITIIDAYLYYSGTSLQKIGLVICPNLPKLEMPVGLGSKMFFPKDKDFIEYAMRDAEIAYYLGLEIMNWHKKFDVSLAFTGPHFASKVFRRKFLKHPIPLPPMSIVYASMASYHGGKNNITQKNVMIPRVYSLDIISAYPAAMRDLPSFSQVSLYKIYKTKSLKKTVPYHGVYRCSGEVFLTSWPLIYTHDFKPIVGVFSNIWITGYEVNQALSSKAAKFTSIEGYYYDSAKDKRESPFIGYVDTFFALKNTAESESERLFYKVSLLNALYGKFIQTQQNIKSVLTPSEGAHQEDETVMPKAERIISAGGLFNPFIATLITGSVRAKIHSLELKYKAIHTATDGIMTLIKPDQKDLGSGLGDLKIEGVGRVLLVRTKCYIMYVSTAEYKELKVKKPGLELQKSGVYPDLYILKAATHGFYGKLEVFEKMVFEGKREYITKKPTQLKTALRSNTPANKFVEKTVTFNY